MDQALGFFVVTQPEILRYLLPFAIFLTYLLNLSLGNSESDEEDVSVPSLSSQNSAFGKSIIILTYYALYYQFPHSVMGKLKKNISSKLININ